MSGQPEDEHQDAHEDAEPDAVEDQSTQPGAEADSDADGTEEALVSDEDMAALRAEIARRKAYADKYRTREVLARQVARWYTFLREAGLDELIEHYMERGPRFATAQEQARPAELRVKVDWKALQAACAQEVKLLTMIGIVCGVDRAEAERISMAEFAVALQFFLPHCTMPMQAMLGIAPVLEGAMVLALDHQSATRQK